MTNDQLQLNRSLIYPFTHLRIDSLVNQIDQSMQNKPNFLQNRANVSYAKSNGYKNAHRFLAQKSQTQFPKRRNEPKSLYINELRTTNHEL